MLKVNYLRELCLVTTTGKTPLSKSLSVVPEGSSLETMGSATSPPGELGKASPSEGEAQSDCNLSV